MGFQINGTEVVGTNGLANVASPSFKTLLGNSILGTGNIQDNGADALGFNTVGSYTFAHADFSGFVTQNSYASNSAMNQNDSNNRTKAGSALKHPYYSSYGGYCYVIMDRAGTSLAQAAYCGCSGTWMMKTPDYREESNSWSILCLWQRIS